MIKKHFKKYKFNQLQYIQQTYKYIYIFRYNDLIINENILLKKQLKKLEYKSLILKQKLIDNIFFNLKSQGAVLIIYGNNNIDILKNLLNFQKIELIYLKINTSIFSKLKLKKIFMNNISLNIIIIQPFLKFLYFLKKI
jgi:hypothetical protein